MRACETLRAAIANATRLRAAAEAAAFEATSDSAVNKGKNQSNGTTSTGNAATATAATGGSHASGNNGGVGGGDNGVDDETVGGRPYCGPSLSRIIECRTQAEHKAIAVACSHLRASVDLPPVKAAAAAGPALPPSSPGYQGGGGKASSVVTSRASFSGGGSHASSTHGGGAAGSSGGLSGRLSGRASSRDGDNFNGSPREVAPTTVPALWVALDALVGQGGPWSGLQTPSSASHLQGGGPLLRDYDGVNVVDPNQVGDFAGALSMEQVGRSTQLSNFVVEFASEF